MRAHSVNNVIYVDFRGVAHLSEREQYLNLLAAELDELDFQDFVEAVNDPEAYKDVDPELQALVNRFYQLAG